PLTEVYCRPRKRAGLCFVIVSISELVPVSCLILLHCEQLAGSCRNGRRADGWTGRVLPIRKYELADDTSSPPASSSQWPGGSTAQRGAFDRRPYLPNARRKASCPLGVMVTTRERRARRIQPRT